MKKILAFVILGIFIGTTGALAVSKIFPDVPSDAWYAWAVRDLSDVGIIKGYADGTFRPSEKVNRAEMAVMLAQTIQYIKNGSVSPSPVATNDITFDACGPLKNYKNNNWFSSLNEKYLNDFLKPQGIMSGTVGEDGEGCLSSDRRFVFIPDFSEFGCGRIFQYDIAAGDYNPINSTLKEATGSKYCASEFGKRTGNYISFTGSEAESTTCRKYNGKYYYLENRVEVSITSC